MSVVQEVWSFRGHGRCTVWDCFVSRVPGGGHFLFTCPDTLAV